MEVLQVKKRNDELVPFDQMRIVVAIEGAMSEVDSEEEPFSNELAQEIAEAVEEEIIEMKDQSIETVETVSDRVEDLLMSHNYRKTAKRYILYREERRREREKTWDFTDLQKAIFKDKYEFQHEGLDGFFKRVAGGNKNAERMMRLKQFLPAGRILAGRGLTDHGVKLCYSNCFVLKGPSDSLPDIFEVAKKMAITYSRGGGCGTTLGYLRPAGAKVNNSAKETTGPITFAGTYSHTTGVIGQKNRRGALMLTMPVHHPDIVEFINAKTNTDEITKANISVQIDDAFMEAVVNDEDYELYFKVEDTGEVVQKTIRANALMDLIAENNHDWGEPGMLYWTRVEKWHLNSETQKYHYEAPNPCGEKPLIPDGSCLLSSLNLAEFVRNAFEDNAELDSEGIYNATQKIVVYLDEVLDEGISLLPLPGQQEVARDYRQIGVGVMGVADMLIKLGIRYGSKESIKISEKIGSIMINAALQQSALMAKDHGTYPKYDREAVLRSPFLRFVAWPETYELVKEHGLRHAELLSIAPTGTISSMIGISGGIEPIYNYSYTRKTETLSEEGDMYYTIYTQIVREYMEHKGIEREEDLPDFFTNAMVLDPNERVDFQAAWQKYVDAAISSTVNLPKSATVEDVKNVYIRAWEKGLKGITVFRDGCKRLGILTSSDKNETEETKDLSIEDLETLLAKKKLEAKKEEEPQLCST